jgi:hypothetical protein
MAGRIQGAAFLLQHASMREQTDRADLLKKKSENMAGMVQC